MSARASGADAKPNGEARSRSHNDGSSTRAFTPEQKAAVIRVRKCSATAFYDILGLEAVKSSCTDSEIKKAYRKLSLLTHPDKNGYDGADEAFKMVSRAFQVLSDADKKSKFDKFGGDPDSRFSAASSSSSPFSGFSQGATARGPMFEEEISPEEMFRQFFGGGMGGGPFGGGPFGGIFDTGSGFVFNMGGPGVRVHQFGGNRPRRRPHNHAPDTPPSAYATLQSLLPIILIFIFPLISSFFSNIFSSSTSSGPSVRFDGPRPPQTYHRTSEGLKTNYWVNPTEVKEYGAREWTRLDKRVDNRYLTNLQYDCEAESDRRVRLQQEAMGFFFTDTKKLDEARNMPMPSCSRLHELGYRGPVR
ncbi:DUF1977-domain-containing protein [Myriangium duriaei CBS 260.36]|uniref:DUF1977-domain-containing protein n=1 Tax=Myriangium duriaei CBS 260.36 TaxID=1168546 RepID=A0A9P4J8U3_9PEZI|nr:DUF1977-domain-containing protein [Myriangium duriaei CBS 260.36]